MLVTDDDIVIDVSELQYWNANEPMLVTDDGIVIEVSELQPLNACESMRAPSVITTVFSDVGT